MVEGVVYFSAEWAYEELKKILLANKCKIISEDPPRSITVEHGSLWASRTRDVKKRVNFILIPQGSKTKIVAYTSLTRDCVALLVFVFALLFIIILIDVILVILLINVETLLNTWGWLIDLLYGSGLARNIQDALNIGRIFIIFSVIVLVLCIISDVYIYTRREAFAEEVIRSLLNTSTSYKYSL
jgi:hypothetical protein